MSGVPSWALSEPSTNRTAEWTTLCGWTTTSIASYVDIVQPVRFDHFQALVRERRRVDRDLRAHRPGRMAEGLSAGDGRQVRRARRGTDRPTRSGSSARPPPSVRRPGTARSRSARESIGRSQASGLAHGSSGPIAATVGGARPRQRHHQVAARDERLLVRGRDDLARRERGEDRAEVTMPPVATTTRSTSSRDGELAASGPASGADGQPVRRRPAEPAGLLGRAARVRAGRQRDDLEAVRMARPGRRRAWRADRARSTRGGRPAGRAARQPNERRGHTG